VELVRSDRDKRVLELILRNEKSCNSLTGTAVNNSGDCGNGGDGGGGGDWRCGRLDVVDAVLLLLVVVLVVESHKIR